MNKMTNKIVVIYCRYSTDMQSEKSCDDQEREVRAGLTRRGIDHSTALVLKDQAMSGTRGDRPDFERLIEMISKGEISILAVEEQSRLTRNFDATSIIQDLKFSGGRYLSISDNIDSDDSSWKLVAGFKQIQNNVTIDETSSRVRRGQKGRVLGNLSAGDFPFGYESFYVDPDAVLRMQKGKKPEKKICILERQAIIVREIFSSFNEGQSIHEIARGLTQSNVPRGNRAPDTKWSHHQVRRILANSKYIGDWVWGKTKTVRDGGSRKRQAATPVDSWVYVIRPELRIIDDVTWEKTKSLLKLLWEKYGKRSGQLKRGPAVHHSDVYPTRLLNGLLECQCGAKMHQRSRHRLGETKGPMYFVCPTAHRDPNSCSMKSYVPADKAVKAVLGLIVEELRSHQDWQSIVLQAMEAEIQKISTAVPISVAELQRKRNETQRKLDKLVDALTEGGLTGTSVKSRLDHLEAELETVSWDLAQQKQLLSSPLVLPDEKWIKERFQELSSLLTDQTKQAAILLRKLVPRIVANAVIAPGKRRGYTQIRFSFSRHNAVLTAIDDERMTTLTSANLADSVLDREAPLGDFVVDLGCKTKFDKVAPRIAVMRAAGHKWSEIATETGVSLGNAYNVWARYMQAITGKKPAKSKGAPISKLLPIASQKSQASGN